MPKSNFKIKKPAKAKTTTSPRVTTTIKGGADLTKNVK